MSKHLTYLTALVLLLGIVGEASAAVSSYCGIHGQEGPPSFSSLNITTRASSNSSWTGRVTARLIDCSGLSPGGVYGIHGYRFDDA